MKIKSAFSLILCLVLCQSVGGLGAFFTYPEIEGWHASLQKPSFNPPNWVFSPVWTTLYVLMGISLWTILNAEKTAAKKTALIAFTFQLILNSIWSFLFFNLHSPFAALVEVIFLWFAILFWIIKTYPVCKWGALINIPYLMWVSFASLLNFSFWKLNV